MLSHKILGGAITAERIFGKTANSEQLAKLVAEYDRKLTLEKLDNGRWRVKGPYITITRDMLEKAYFSKGGPKNPKTIDRMLYGYALVRKGCLIAQTKDKIVIGDDDGERAITTRLRIDEKQEIEKYAKNLGISRNQFILKAIKYFISFLKSSEKMIEDHDQADD